MKWFIRSWEFHNCVAIFRIKVTEFFILMCLRCEFRFWGNMMFVLQPADDRVTRYFVKHHDENLMKPLDIYVTKWRQPPGFLYSAGNHSSECNKWTSFWFPRLKFLSFNYTRHRIVNNFAWLKCYFHHAMLRCFNGTSQKNAPISITIWIWMKKLCILCWYSNWFFNGATCLINCEKLWSYTTL